MQSQKMDLQSTKEDVSIENVEFKYCSSFVGGALYVSNQSVLSELKKIRFIENKAQLYGDNYSFQIQDIILTKIYEYNPQFQSTNLFLFELTNPIQLKRGLSYIITLEIKINDQYYPQTNQRIESLNMYPYLKDNSNFQVSSDINIQSPYLYYYQDLLYRKDNFDIEIQIMDYKYKAICNFKYQIQEDCPQDMEKVIINQKYIDSNSKRSYCKQCDYQYYSLCYANYSQIREGYWRKSYSLQNNEVVACSFSPQSCTGGYEIENKLCYEGHIGPQCLNCDIKGEYWNDSYSLYGNFQCTKCSQIQKNTIKVFFTSLKSNFYICEDPALQFLDLLNFKRINKNKRFQFNQKYIDCIC
ncbi:hypothetical protein TTHERM_00994390 (macronuclear) [Tetrahymena thermophila SB210]|uniref:Transmembrane protein n=1 Tax=Tetrahymena thermophila (strain SB210) TaxID=312017 RepID=Q247Q8_TETTS|nr:hypothetical protein TTHERM_00994390 [Tetrahymena thermophila SB210]EAS04042.2 hypothetical protein TTHERM_00994390 [Tetrahymena thermophila SB210]|eukprot:XP_001024287.2 hypothetical protein TTHERM_00994390 [Tetrahymena thermophila SB210]